MPRAAKPMTWSEPTKRWTKKYRGKQYFVSCRQLGCDPTASGSERAMRAWWATEKEKIDTRELEKWAAGEVVKELVANSPEVWEAMKGHELAMATADLTAEQKNRLLPALDKAFGENPRRRDASKTVAGAVENWKKFLAAKIVAGGRSVTRAESYAREIAEFVRFVGGESLLSVIDGPKIDAYYGFLGEQIAAGRFAPITAKNRLMTAKQFVTHLAMSGAIPMPMVLSGRKQYPFDCGAKMVATVEISTIRQALAVANDRCKLFLWLGLNCGMLQSDVANLLRSEVDIVAGTIRRSRTKQRKNRRLNAQVVTYALWPETVAALKPLLQTSGELALLTEDGTALVRYSPRSDSVQSALHVLFEQTGLPFAFKNLRATGATLISDFPGATARNWACYYLANSPKGVTESHYAMPSDTEFAVALAWLGEQIIG